MRIGLDDIDPPIAEALLNRLGAPPNEFLHDNIRWGGFGPMSFAIQFNNAGLKIKRKREPTDDERSAFKIRKKREEQMAAALVGTLTLPWLAATIVVVGITTVSVPIGIAAGVGTFVGCTALGMRWTLRATAKERLRRAIGVEELRAASRLLSLSRAERVYCDALLLLVDTDAGLETDTTLRSTLRQLNALLACSRQLEKRRQSMLPLMGAHAIPEVEAEVASLASRLEAATDSQTREMLQQSLQMCTTRLENARAFEHGMERLNAQQEAVLHTLSSALSAMARLQLHSDPQIDLAAQEIADTVSLMTQQTLAMEQAVEEVMTLRSM